MVRRSWLLLVSLIGLSPALLAQVSEPDLLRLTSPANGTVLSAGALVELAWEPGKDLAQFSEAREWEAFLSLNGGKTFPLRITPHLDLDQRRILFRVPQVAADDVRILLRVGDEKEERSQHVPSSWSIAATSSYPLPINSRARQAAFRGEAARAGDEGVWSWMEDRGDGTWIEYQAIPDQPAFGAVQTDQARAWNAILDRQAERERIQLASLPTSETLSQATVEPRRPLHALLLSKPILLLVQRFNE